MTLSIPIFILVIMFSACCGYFICALLVTGARADENIEASYWKQMYFSEKEQNENYKILEAK